MESYPDYAWHPEHVVKVNASCEHMADLIWKENENDIEVVKKYTGIDPTELETYRLSLINQTTYDYNKTDTICSMINNRALLGY